jgi:coenzyme F420-reducing hydrogenase gamma subunit
MRKLALALPLLALGACAADGGFQNPLEMTQEVRCANATMALALAEANNASPDMLDRIAASIAVLCPAA